jgi:hypothetical protein
VSLSLASLEPKVLVDQQQLGPQSLYFSLDTRRFGAQVLLHLQRRV